MTDRQNKQDLLPAWLGPLMEIAHLLGDSLAETITERMAGQLPDFESQSKKTSYELEAIKDQIAALAVSRDLLANANQTNRLLGAQFYQERIIEPMVRGLFPIIDMVCDAIGRPGVDREYLLGLRAQLEQYLGCFGIESFNCEACSPFDPKTMRPLQTAVTHEADLDGLVAESLRCGFRTTERLLRLETVSLYKLEIPLTKLSTQSERIQL